MKILLKYLIPIMAGWTKFFDRRVLFDHLVCYHIAGFVGIKTTVDFTAVCYKIM